jgi:hypothetical protein
MKTEPLERQARQGTLVMLACHGYFDPVRDAFTGDHAQDRPVYEAQLVYALKHAQWRKSDAPFLVISGGMTRPLPGSEARTYVELAGRLGQPMPAEYGIEELSLTSIENLLFSLYVYHQHRGGYPAQVDVVSWGFKRDRFEQTLQAISRWAPLGQSWAQLNYFPVGDLPGPDRMRALAVEQEYLGALSLGIEAYYRLPRVQETIRRRDHHDSRARSRAFFKGYPLPF